MPKRKGLYVANYKRFIIFLFVLISILVLIVGLVLFNLSRNSLTDDFIPVSIDDEMQYTIRDDFYLTLSGDILSRYDYDGEAIWSKKVYTEGLNLFSSDRLIIIYSNKNLQVLTSEGEYLYSTDVIGTINDVKCGINVVAVFSEIAGEDGKKENMIYFYNTAGSLFDSISFIPQNIIDFGFLSDDDLWVLTTDPTNVVPVSRIITYKPGVSMTGLTNLFSELVYKTYFTASNMYVATTKNLIKYDLFGQKLGESMIYDWDIKTETLTSGEPFFVAVPRSQNEEPYYSNARIINERVSYKVNLPKNVENMVINDGFIYFFGEDIIYVYSLKGEYLRQYQLDESVEFIELASKGMGLIKKEGLYYFLTLP